jgi:hypothetical protein
MAKKIICPISGRKIEVTGCTNYRALHIEGKEAGFEKCPKFDECNVRKEA